MIFLSNIMLDGTHASKYFWIEMELSWTQNSNQDYFKKYFKESI